MKLNSLPAFLSNLLAMFPTSFDELSWVHAWNNSFARLLISFSPNTYKNQVPCVLLSCYSTLSLDGAMEK